MAKKQEIKLTASDLQEVGKAQDLTNQALERGTASLAKYTKELDQVKRLYGNYTDALLDKRVVTKSAYVTLTTQIMGLKKDMTDLTGVNATFAKKMKEQNDKEVKAIADKIAAQKTEKASVQDLTQSYLTQKRLQEEQYTLAKHIAEEERKTKIKANEDVAKKPTDTPLTATDIAFNLKQSQEAEVTFQKEAEENAKKHAEELAKIDTEMYALLEEKQMGYKLHTSGFWKGVIDINGTKEQMAEIKTEVEGKLQLIKEEEETIKKSFDEQIKAAEGNVAAEQKLQNEKEVALKAHGEKVKAETTDLQNILTEIEKNGQGMRAKQLKGYVDRTFEIVDDAQKRTDSLIAKVADYKWVKESKATFEQLQKIGGELNDFQDKKIDAKAKKEKAAIDKELAALNEGVSEKKAEAEKLKAENAEAKKKEDDYNAKIKKYQEMYGVKPTPKEEPKEIAPEGTTDPIPSDEIAPKETTDPIPSDEITPEETEEEKIKREKREEQVRIAQEQVDIFAGLAEEEKKIREEKTDRIKELDEELFLSDNDSFEKKKALEAKKVEIDAKAAKDKEKNAKKLQSIADAYAKIEKLKALKTAVFGIKSSIASTAEGATAALKLGPIVGPIKAAMITTLGAIKVAKQVKTVAEMSADLAKFEDGGLLQGKRHRSGGMRIEGSNIEVEGGEYVVNRESTSKNIDLVRYINSQQRELSPTDLSAFFGKTARGFEPPFSRSFEAGGELPAMQNTAGMDNDALVDAIKSIKFNPKVAVTDIIRVQDEMASVDNWAGM